MSVVSAISKPITPRTYEGLDEIKLRRFAITALPYISI
jgi:hypothetical protein